MVQQDPALDDLVLESDHLVHQVRILLRNRVDRLDPGDEVVEAAGTEDDGERGLLLIRRVDRDEPPLEHNLRLGEISAGDAQRLPVDVELALDGLQSLARRLVAAVRQLSGCIELLQPLEHGLSLRPFGGDLVRVCTRGRRPE